MLVEMKHTQHVNRFEVTDVCKNEKKGTFSQVKCKKKKMKTSSFVVYDQEKDDAVSSKIKKSKNKGKKFQLEYDNHNHNILAENSVKTKSDHLQQESSDEKKFTKGKAKKFKTSPSNSLMHGGPTTAENGFKLSHDLAFENGKKSNIKTDKKSSKIPVEEISPKDSLLHNKSQTKRQRRNDYDSKQEVKTNILPPMKRKKKRKVFNKPTLEDTGFMWDLKLEDFDKLNEPVGEDEDDEDEDDVSPSKSKRKKTKGEKLQEMKEEEARLRLVEQALLEAENNPTTADQFDRALLARPDNSDLWIKFIAHHLQATEIDKGRAVARRALQTISQRLDVERLNVWIALLNLENMFGTQESLKSTLDEALRTNDEFTVYSKMLNIYTESKKSQETEQLVTMMLKKFRSSSKCWLDCSAALMNINLPDKARNLVQRAISALPNKEHVNLLCKFALVENQHGFSEQSQALFEHILTSYPKRTDIWNVYVDMLVKANKITVARQILERACRQKLPPRNMKMLFNKWISFEEKHGSAEKVEHVRKQAETYVERLTKNL